MIAGLVLAAGAGRRFGAPKQLAELRGRPLLEHVVAAMAAAPLDRVVVVLGAGADDVLARVDMHGAEPVVCDGWQEGMAASLRTGIQAVADAAAVVVILGDQPLVSAAAVARVIEARGGDFDAVRASYGGVPGHPVLLERALFAGVRQLTGDEGARSLLRGARVREVACDGLGSPVDVDTVQQLEELESGDD